MSTFRGKAAVADRLIPSQGKRITLGDDPPVGQVYEVTRRSEWNFTAKLSTVSNAVRFASDTSDHRLIISGLSMLMLAVGGIGFLAGWPWAHTVGLAFYVFIGIGGAPWALARRMRLPTRLAMTALSTLVIPTFVGTMLLRVGGWHPALAFVLLAAISLPLHGYGFYRAVTDRRQRERPAVPVAKRLARKHLSVSLVLSPAGGALCLLAALTHQHIEPGLWGFLAVIGPVWYLGLALVLISFAVSRASSDASVAVAVLILLLILTGTPALVYDGARATSAAKHIAFVQQIRHLHRIDTSVAIYQSWPGYFAAMAWVCDVAGIRDPMRLAIWWPTLIGLFKLAGLRFLAGTLLTSRTAAWVAVALAVLADPIGADYFSPQSVGFVIGLLSFAIALSHYGTPLKTVALTGAGCALAVSHQLSPYLVGGTLVILAVLRQVRPWWLPATVLVPAGIWAVMHRSSLTGFLDLRDVGNAKNFRPPATTTADGLTRQPIVSLSSWALAAGILLLGLIAVFVVLKRRRSIEVWALAAAPAAGLAVIAVNPYGQEGIFRAALFGIPWLALLAAQLFREGSDGRPNVRLIVVLSALTVTFLTACFGMDGSNVIRAGDRAAFAYFAAQPATSRVPAYTLPIGPGDLPSIPPGKAQTHVTLVPDDLPPLGVSGPAEDPATAAARLTAGLLITSGEAPAEAQLYALWSPASSYHGWEYGLDRPEHFAAVREAFRASPNWSVAFESGGSVLFRYHVAVSRPASRPAASGAAASGAAASRAAAPR
jgi:hypothetical protein